MSAHLPRFLDQRTVEAEKNERVAFAALWTQLPQTYGRLSLFEAITLDAGYCSLRNASLIEAAGYGYGIGLKSNQTELLRQD